MCVLFFFSNVIEISIRYIVFASISSFHLRNALHYQPYTSVELFPCMERSKTGWQCPDVDGGPCRKASCAYLPEGQATSSLSVNETTSAQTAANKVLLSANATLNSLLQERIKNPASTPSNYTTSLLPKNASGSPPSESRSPSEGYHLDQSVQRPSAVNSSMHKAPTLLMSLPLGKPLQWPKLKLRE